MKKTSLFNLKTLMKDSKIKLIVGETYYYGVGNNNPKKCKLEKIHNRDYSDGKKRITVISLPIKKGYTGESFVIYSDEIRLTRKEALKNTLK